MKVLSIRQPWATLIVEGYKDFEFRNWKTNFRGKFLIHASKGVEPENMDRFRHLNLEYPTGCIIGSAEITDCIKVEKKFEDELIEKDELIYGVVRNRGGYAFQLEKIEKFKSPIPAIGSLGFWEYYDEFEIMDQMEKIRYGWVDKSGKIHEGVDANLNDDYRLQNPKEVMKSEVGTCWDQVELERFYFHGHTIKTYFLAYYDNKNCPTHTFLTFEKQGKYYWFEHSYKKYRGIHEYNSEKELLIDVRSKFMKDELERLNSKFDKYQLVLREYRKPKSHLTIEEFYKHCEKNMYIDLDSL